MKQILLLSIIILTQGTVFAQTENTNGLLKLTVFTGQWNYVEYTKDSSAAEFEINNSGEANIYFTTDSTAIVVDETGKDGHLFRGIHTYNLSGDFYNNFSVRTNGGTNWSHYRWDDIKNKAVWYEGETTDPNDPDSARKLNSNNFSAEWHLENTNEQIFQVKIFENDEILYARKVVYTRK